MSMQEPRISIEYQHTISDHVHAIRTYDGVDWRGQGNKVIAILLALMGVFSVAIGMLWWAFICFILAPLAWFHFLSLYPLRLRAWFRANPNLSETYRLEFSDSGIHWTTPTIDSHIAWTHYNRVIESPRVFLLVYGKMMYSVIPKSAFASDEQMQEFRDLLQRNIGSEAKAQTSSEKR